MPQREQQGQRPPGVIEREEGPGWGGVAMGRSGIGLGEEPAASAETLHVAGG